MSSARASRRFTGVSAKDTKALIKIAQDYDVSLRILESVLAVNENRKRAMARKVSQALGGSLDLRNVHSPEDMRAAGFTY
jgi:UDP-glucose 6-dehydrogenase